MEKELYFVRHGETELNKLGIVQGSGLDTVLNETGWKQSHLLYEKYGHLDFDLVITSALQRTWQTVDSFIQKGIPWIQMPELNEISWGTHEGQPGTGERIAAYETMIAAWGRGELDAHLPEGESATALIARADAFLEFIRPRPDQRILICTHGRMLRCLISRIKGLPPAGMEQILHKNTGVYHLRLHGRNSHFFAENDTSHLNG